MLENALYVPDLSYNLFPVGVMDRAGNSAFFDEIKCLFRRNETKNIVQAISDAGATRKGVALVHKTSSKLERKELINVYGLYGTRF